MHEISDTPVFDLFDRCLTAKLNEAAREQNTSVKELLSSWMFNKLVEHCSRSTDKCLTKPRTSRRQSLPAESTAVPVDAPSPRNRAPRKRAPRKSVQKNSNGEASAGSEEPAPTRVEQLLEPVILCLCGATARPGFNSCSVCLLLSESAKKKKEMQLRDAIAKELRWQKILDAPFTPLERNKVEKNYKQLCLKCKERRDPLQVALVASICEFCVKPEDADTFWHLHNAWTGKTKKTFDNAPTRY